MKKLLCALTALAIVLTLTQGARAEWHNGDICPGCGEASVYVKPFINEGYHEFRCSSCTYFEDTYPGFWGCTEKHFGGTATCKKGPVCEGCGLEYGERDPNAHVIVSWSEGPSDYDESHVRYATHTGTCQECDRTFSERHSLEVVDSVPAKPGEPGHAWAYVCSVCGGRYENDRGTDRLSDDDWYRYCLTVSVNDGKMGSAFATNPSSERAGKSDHIFAYPNAGYEFDHWKVVSGVSGGVTIKDTKAAQTTITFNALADAEIKAYFKAVEYDVNEHVNDAGCVSSSDGNAQGHDLTEIKAVEPTCTEEGNSAYWYCSWCEQYFSDKDGNAKIEKDSWILPAKGHWYDAWQPAAEGQHIAPCFRCGRTNTVDCTMIEIPQTDAETKPIRICPICGYCKDGAKLTAVEKTNANGAVPSGDLAVFVTAKEEEPRFLAVAFEVGGRLVQPRGEVTVAIPAEILEGFDPVLIGQDGAGTPVECGLNGDQVSFTLDFMPDNQPIQAMILKLIRKN